MNDPTPHYLLMSEASRTAGLGRWRFELRPLDGSSALEVADVEPGVWGERLDLLTVVRALESLDRPSRVTLIGCTRYVEQGILYGLPEWRDNGWQWEYFGTMAPVRDCDLWQRMDHALHFHRVECGKRRFDLEHASPRSPHWDLADKPDSSRANCMARSTWLRNHAPMPAALCEAWNELVSYLWQKMAGWKDFGAGFRAWAHSIPRLSSLLCIASSDP